MKRKRWPWVALAAVAVILVALFALDRFLRPYDLATERAAARAAGIPLTPAEFHRPRPAPDQDAAPDWNALAALLSRRPLADAITDGTEPGTPHGPRWEDVAAALRARRDVAEWTRRIATRRGAYFPHAWSITETYPYLNTMRAAARFTRTQALTFARQDRWEDAVAVAARGFRMADHAAMDPLIISSLVSAAIESDTSEALGRILQMAGPNARVASAIRRALEANPSRRSLALCLQGDALLSVRTIRTVQSVEAYREYITPIPLVHLTPPDPPAPPRTPRRNGLVVRYVAEPGEAAYLRRIVPYLQAARLPEPARSARFDDLGRHQAARTFAFGDVLADMMIPVLAKLPDRDRQAAARRATLAAAASVMKYRANEGRWPARLEDAMAKPSVDPFTGRAVGYQRDGDAFIVFSAGTVDGKQPIAFTYPPFCPAGKERRP